jgi:hypothetical protein
MGLGEEAGRGVLGRNSPPLNGSVLITDYSCTQKEMIRFLPLFLVG